MPGWCGSAPGVSVPYSTVLGSLHFQYSLCPSGTHQRPALQRPGGVEIGFVFPRLHSQVGFLNSFHSKWLRIFPPLVYWLCLAPPTRGSGPTGPANWLCLRRPRPRLSVGKAFGIAVADNWLCLAPPAPRLFLPLPPVWQSPPAQGQHIWPLGIGFVVHRRPLFSGQKPRYWVCLAQSAGGSPAHFL